MAEACKNAKRVSDLLHTQWSEAKKENEVLSTRLLQVEAQLKEANERLSTCDFAEIPHVPDKRIKKLQDLVELVKIEIGKFLDSKNTRIQALRRELHELMAAKNAETEKIKEMELYIKMQEEQSNHSAQLVIEKEEIHTRQELAGKYQEKWLTLLVVEAKLHGINESIQNCVDNLQNEIVALKYQNTMGEEKVRGILTQHNQKMKEMMTDSLNEGWKTCSKQALELQLLRVDHDNRKQQGQGYFKMDEDAINTLPQELANDIYELATSHREGITQFLEELHGQQIETTVKVDGYEKE